MAWSMARWALLITFTPVEVATQLTSPIYYPNGTSSSVVTAPPLPTGSTYRNWNCSPCAIVANAASEGGLQQVLWYTESISLTLDTVSIFVTTYNGSNATALTRYSTIYGDINTVDPRKIPAVQSIYSASIVYYAEQYIGGGSMFLARGTDGSIGSATSYGWPTPYILVSAIASSTTVPYSGCPSGLQKVETGVLAGRDCGCAFTKEYVPNPRAFLPGVSATDVLLPSNFYVPMSPMGLNMSLLENGGFSEYAPFNETDLVSWLLKQPWASTLLPNLEQCTMVGIPQGPPGVKIPVSALTTTVTTTTHAASRSASGSVESSSSHALPGLYPNPMSTSTATPAPNPSPSKTPFPKGSSNVASDTSLSKDGSTTISSDDNAAVNSGGSSNINNGDESAVSVATASSSSIALAVQHSGASVPPSIRILSIAGNSEMLAHPSATSATAVPATQAVVASQTILLPSSAVSQLAIAGTTLAASGPAATIADQVVSLQSDALIVGTSTVSFVGPEETVPVATTGGDLVHSLPGNSALVVAGTTLKLSASAMTIAGTAVSLGSSNLVIGSSTVALPSTSLDIVHTTSTRPNTPYPSEVMTLDHTITQGAPAITVLGTTISLGSSGLAIGFKTVSIPFSASTAVITFAGQIITQHANSIIIAGHTLSQGAPAVTASGTVISLGSSGLVLGSSTIPLPTQGPSSTTFALGGHTFTANAATIAIGGTTLTEDAPAATISGTLISLSPSKVIIGSSAYALPTSFLSTLLSINDETFTINPTGVLAPGSTLSVGGSAITIDGTMVSLGTAGIVVGTSTIPYDNAASSQTTQQGIGSAIIAGFGTTSTTTKAPSSTTTGATTSSTTNGAIPSETMFPPVSRGRAAKQSLDSLLVAIVALVMALMVCL